MPLQLHDTQSRRQIAFTPADPARVTFYTCGPTVYDDAHIGNFRSFLAADLLRRFIESRFCELTAPDGSSHAGPREVVHVMNITDVGHMTDDSSADGGGEDKMAAAQRRLTEAKKSGELPPGVDIDPTDQLAIAGFYMDRFFDDARRLGMKVAAERDTDPTLTPRATDSIKGMVALIERLIERGHAYAVGEDGAQTVYFAVETFDGYGSVSGNTLDSVRSGAGGRISDSNQSSKRHPADFLLWKADPTHAMRWPSPWGEGYPGWHVECSVMALDRLNNSGAGTIDLHSGGEDNIFPHHECENAQSCCATGAERFARLWFHPRFLLVDGEKMSKSKGNFYTARQLFDKGHEPAAVRLELIKTHYRANASLTEQGLKDSARMVARWRAVIDNGSGSGADASARDAAAAAFSSAMHDDLNIAGAIGAINSWTGSLDKPSSEDAALMREFDAVLGVCALEKPAEAETSIGVFLSGLEPDPAVVALLEERAEARRNKDFAASDRIRDELASRGLSIKDVAGGKVEVSRA